MKSWYTFFIILLLTACTQPPPPAASARKPTVHLVKTIIASAQPLSTSANYTGKLRARRIARIFTQESGRITHIPYYEGDTIKANTLLVQLDDTLLKAELNKTIATHKYARINVQRYQKLAKQKIVSADELARAQTELEIALAEKQILQTRLSYTKITAPFSGIITARLAEPDDVINANTHILTMIDPSSLIIDINISSRLLSQLKLGDTVQIEALGKGKISRIHPTINAHGLGKIEIILHSLPKGARAGQFCRVTISNQISPRITLPYTALRRDREGEYVFIVDADNKAQRQTVHSGRRLADRVEIIKGVKDGQIVVIKGFLGLQ
ncbi:MAG: efflux RND transporter periplasmic adaptor subunit, partial [Pseudomonadota bacterium]